MIIDGQISDALRLVTDVLIIDAPIIDVIMDVQIIDCQIHSSMSRIYSCYTVLMKIQSKLKCLSITQDKKMDFLTIKDKKLQFESELSKDAIITASTKRNATF